MCWYSCNKPVRKIADKDITCWKVVHLINSGFKSIYFGKPYEIHKRYSIHDEIYIDEMHDKLYIDKMHALITTRYDIHKGFHSYNNKVFIEEDGSQKVVMNEHRKMWYDRFHSMSNLHIVKCIIPEGSIYYENEDGELVSSSIIIRGLDED